MEKNVRCFPRLALRRRSFFFALGLLMLTSAAVSAQPVLVTDISSTSHSFVSANGQVYFASNDSLFNALTGSVIFIKKLNEPIESISGITIGNKVFIITNTGSGKGLWASSGTAASTVKIGTYSEIFPLISFQNELYLGINNGVNGRELWKVSTSNVASMLKDINPGAADGYAFTATVSNNQMFFIANDNTGRDIWKTDGSSVGTVKVVDVPFGDIIHLKDVNGTMFFSRDIPDEWTYENDVELWKTQGTPATTQLVKDFGPQIQHQLTNFTPHQGRLFFVLSYGNPDNYLWVSDGTDAGTYEVTNINIDGYVNTLRSFNDHVVYYSETQGMFNEIAKSNGTAAGTSIVHQLNYMWASTSPDYVDLTLAGDRLFFVDHALNEGDWPAPDEEYLIYESSPGYTPGTTLSLREKYNFPYNNTRNLVAISNSSNEVFFTTQTSGTNTKLWFYDPDNQCAGTGGLTREVWTNIDGINVTRIPLTTPPQRVETVTSFKGPVNEGDRYGARYRGYLCVPTTGNYKFFIASDDYSDLYLSTTASPADKKRIAYVQGYTKEGEFTKYPSQQSVLIPLVKGTKYYIEALHKEGGTYDHITVAMQLPNGSMENPIQGSRLIPFESNELPQVTITSPTEGQQIDYETQFIVKANATDPDGTIVKVEFYLQTGQWPEEKIGVDFEAPYEAEALFTLQEGSHTVTAKAYDNQNSVSTTSVTFTVIRCSASGQILREVWTNVKGQSVTYIPVNSTPTSTGYLNLFEGPTNTGDHYGARIRGYLCPPSDGNYTFYISSDDHSELWLSDGSDPANKVKIAYVMGATLKRQWNKYASQKSAQIYLRSGRRYYVEVLHKENLGYDHVAVGWVLPNGIAERPIPGTRLSPFEPSSTASADMMVASETTEESSLESKTIQLAPNPVTNGRVTLTTEGLTFTEGSTMNVQLLSLTGEVVYKHEVSCDTDCSQVDLDFSSTVRPGVYIIKGSADGQTFMKRLIVR
jgi:ELWxxDGT repeat protein